MGMINSNNSPLAPLQKVAEAVTAPIREVTGQSPTPPAVSATPEQAQEVFAQNQMLAPVADLAQGAQEALAAPLAAANPAEILENAAGGLPEMLSQGLGAVPGMAQQAIQQVGNLAGVGQNLLAPVANIAENVMGATGLGDVLNETLGGNATGALSNLTDIANLVPVQGLTDGLSQIPGMLQNAVGQLAEGDVLGAVQGVATGAKDLVQGMLPDILESVPDLIGSAGNLIGNAAPMISNLADKAGDILPDLTQKLAPIADAIPGGEELVKAFGEIGGALAPVVSQVATTAGQVAPGVGESTQNLLHTIAPSVQQISDQI